MRTFLIADTHFGHANICNFLRADGSKLRPWDDIQDHDQALIENWNSVVKPEDKVYHLGDVGFRNATYTGRVLESLNGTKVLIKGNHDNLKLNIYQRYFKDVRSVHVLDGILLSHIPVHPLQGSRWRGNVHGHMHANKLDDPWYLNVSLEWTDYKPIDFEQVREYYKNLSKEEYGRNNS